MSAAPSTTSQGQEVVIFQVGNVLCGVDITQIQEINKHLEITPVHHAPSYVKGVINLRGKIVTVIDMRIKFGLPPLDVAHEARMVVIRWQGEQIGLYVDRIHDVLKIEAEDIVAPPANVSGLSGTFFTGMYPTDTGLVALLNSKEVLKQDTMAALGS